MAIEPGQRLGKLLVIRRLGAGGIGAVWEVEHTLTRHRRAMKVLHERYATSPDVVERFLREASAAGRIGNPHIVETFDAGQHDDGTHYLLMELLSGEALSSRLRNSPPTIGEAAGWLRQACLALAAAHAAGIVHRDLKPDNLFLTVDPDGRPFLKVLDFGVSLFEDLSGTGERLTREGSAMGTPLYMSPEQLQGQRVDLRTDLYALGVILYETLTLRAPFDAPTLAALAVKVATGDAPSVQTLRPEVPDALAAVVKRAMHREKAERFGSALELYEALGPFVEVHAAESLGDTLSSSRIKTSHDTERQTPSQPPPGKPRTWLAPAVVATAVALGGGWLGVTRTTEVPRTPVLLPLPGPPEVPTTVIDAGTQAAPVEAPDAGPSAPLDAGRPATDAGRPRGKSSPLITDSPFGGP